MQIWPIFMLKLVIFCNVATTLEGSKILFLFPMPFKSHIMAYSVLVDELVRRGHQVTVLTSHELEEVNCRQIIIDDIKYARKDFNMTVNELADVSVLYFNYLRWNLFAEMAEIVLGSEPVKHFLSSNDEYDVIVGEFFMHQEAFLAFGHRFNAPAIALYPQHLPLSTAELVGNPLSSSFIPDHEASYTERMSFMERLHNTILGTSSLAGTLWHELPKHEEALRKHDIGFEKLPPLQNLIQNVSLVLVNSHFSFHYPRPLAPNIIEIGGFHIKPPKALPPDLQNFMDNASEGVVFVSFGTAIKAEQLSKEQEETFVSVFRAIKPRVLWRWDNPDAGKNSSKVMIQKWIPQQSVLAHPNCVLFVTHGGIASLMEGIYFGIPLLGIPFFCDQFHNVEYIQETGVGLKFDNIVKVTRDELLQSVTTLLNTPSFKIRVKEQSRIFRDQPQSLLERAVFWVEYVIRHKGAHHLKPASVYLPFYQYILLDIVAFISLVLVAAVFLLWKLLAIFCCRNNSSHRKLRPDCKKHRKKITDRTLCTEKKTKTK